MRTRDGLEVKPQLLRGVFYGEDRGVYNGLERTSKGQLPKKEQADAFHRGEMRGLQDMPDGMLAYARWYLRPFSCPCVRGGRGFAPEGGVHPGMRRMRSLCGLLSLRGYRGRLMCMASCAGSSLARSACTGRRVLPRVFDIIPYHGPARIWPIPFLIMQRGD